MRKIVMLTMEAGPNGIFRPGDERDVPDEVAEDLVERRYADYFMEVADEPVEEREKAVATPAIQVTGGKKKKASTRR